jgi:hypothetical protein
MSSFAHQIPFTATHSQHILHVNQESCKTTIELCHIVGTGERHQEDPLWCDVFTPPHDHEIVRQTCRKLAQIPHLDAIVHNLGCVDVSTQHWQIPLQIIQGLPLGLLVDECLSYVVCIQASLQGDDIIERELRTKAVDLARQRVRINIMYRHRSDDNQGLIAFLMSPQSRLMTGATFHTDGRAILTGHPIAERTLAHHIHRHRRP